VQRVIALPLYALLRNAVLILFNRNLRPILGSKMRLYGKNSKSLKKALKSKSLIPNGFLAKYSFITSSIVCNTFVDSI
jgi:hypothetical protein